MGTSFTFLEGEGKTNKFLKISNVSIAARTFGRISKEKGLK